MTAAPAFTSARPPAAAAPRLARWLLRLHRPALLVWTGAVVLLAAALLWLRGPLTDASARAWRQYDACSITGPCSYDQDAILLYKDVYQYATLALLVVPLLAAAWAGAALTGREMESDTARLAWTQGVSPARWLAAKLTLPAVLVAAGTALLVALHHLAWSAGEGRVDNTKPWYDFATFYTNGPALVALALAGLAVGALVGLLRGRSLAALALASGATAVLWCALQLALPHLWPTVTSVSGLDRGTPSGSGITVAQGLLSSTGERLAAPYCGSGSAPSCGELDAVAFYHDYHPRSHYPALQLIATCVLLAVTALSALAAFRLLRRRTA